MRGVSPPGTFEPGFVEPAITETGDGGTGIREEMQLSGSRGVRLFTMGECRIIVSRDPAGHGGEMLWHLSISCRERHPSWDEIKTARYRLLPTNATFGVLLPPPEDYLNVPEQDHVFHVWEVIDAREPA